MSDPLAPDDVREAAYRLNGAMGRTCHTYPTLDDLRVYLREAYAMRTAIEAAITQGEAAMIANDEEYRKLRVAR